MVWEQHCLVIVMTTRVLERGRTKCGQYWEPDEGAEWEHGSFRVRTISVQSNEDYTVSTLELTNSKVSSIFIGHVTPSFQSNDLTQLFLTRLTNHEPYLIGNLRVGRITVFHHLRWQC